MRKVIQAKVHQAISVGKTVVNTVEAKKLNVELFWDDSGLVIVEQDKDYELLIPAYNCFEVRLVKEAKAKK